ncbi:MAG: response regulator [Magnetococcales bacterium]|nr:response regulator [Magnetococcales bacterium]
MSRILIIDDDQSILDFLRECLEKDGYQVNEAVDGKQAALCYRINPADLVITDIFMPVQDGLELIVELKINFPKIKIIAISGGAQTMSAELGLRITKFLGAVQQLEKPFTRKMVLDAVHLELG